MNIKQDGIAPNAGRLLWAGFMAILAAGAGFALRGGIFDNWGSEFGFTATQLGAIGGAGFTGFCFGIIVGGVVCDKIGYGKLVIAAFALHVLSAFVTFGATSPDNAYQMLTIGMFIFAYANGTLEAVANPLVATLFPSNRTHYLNILHASWPLGMIFGALVGWFLDDKMQVHWKIQLALYLIPTVIYGLMFLGQHMPKSEASVKGSSLGEMFKDVGIFGGFIVCYLLTLFFKGSLGLESDTSFVFGAVLLIALGVMSRQIQKPSLESFAGLAVCVLIGVYFQSAFQLSTGGGLAIGLALLTGLALIMRWPIGSFLLFMLFILHALVGAVELGTDGWIQNITGNLFTSEQGKALFLWTSLIMFALRFCADFIEKKLKISPVGLLLICSVLAAVGLLMASTMQTFVVALVALGIYAVGKTFFWPTMLAVASDRFPRTGAVAISIMGGIGMLSAGLIGSPGLGYAKDRFAGEALKESDASVFEDYKSATPSKFLFFGETTGLDGRKLGEIQSTLAAARKVIPPGGLEDETKSIDAKIGRLNDKAKKTMDSKGAIDAQVLEIEELLKSHPEKGIKEWNREHQDALAKLKALKRKAATFETRITKLNGEVEGLAGQKAQLAEIRSQLEAAGVFQQNTKVELDAALAALSPEQRSVQLASISGDRKTLKADAVVPFIMALIYLLMMIYFKSIGGYKPVHIVPVEQQAK